MILSVLHVPSDRSNNSDDLPLVSLHSSKWVTISVKNSQENLPAQIQIQLQLNKDRNFSNSLLNHWLKKYENANLFDIKLIYKGENQLEQEYDYIRGENESVNTQSILWTENNSIKFRLRLNCEPKDFPTQFPLIFELNIRVSEEENSQNILHHSKCRIRLLPLSNENDFSVGETKLKILSVEKFNNKDLFNDDKREENNQTKPKTIYNINSKVQSYIKLSLCVLLFAIVIGCVIYMNKKIDNRSKDYNKRSRKNDYPDEMSTKNGETKMDEFEIILNASTQDGIAMNEPTITNLDRNTWYEMSIRKLTDNYDKDELFIIFKFDLNLVDEKKANISLAKWKRLHKLERQFDIELLPPTEEESEKEREEEENKIKFESTDELRDMANFYWYKYKETRMRIRFNVLSSQYPFSGPKQVFDMPFILKTKILHRPTGKGLATFISQFKTFWPTETEKKNLYATILLAEKEDSPSKDMIKLCPSSSFTTFSSHIHPVPITLTKENVEETYNFSKKFSKFIAETTHLNPSKESTSSSWNIFNIFWNQNQEPDSYLHYMFKEPIDTFLNVTLNRTKDQKANEERRFVGVFLDQMDSFAIKMNLNMAKVLPSPQASKAQIEEKEEEKNLNHINQDTTYMDEEDDYENLIDLKGSNSDILVRTRFELNLINRKFTEKDLISWWSINKNLGVMIETNFTASRLTSEIVLDILQRGINKIDLYWWWPHKNKIQIYQEMIISFHINAKTPQFGKESFVLTMKSFMKRLSGSGEEEEVIIMDSAALEIFSTSRGSAEIERDAWLEKNIGASNLLEGGENEEIMLILNQ